MLKVRLPKLNKRTWIAVSAVVFLALGFSFFFFYKQSPEAEAAWWNEDWRYRKKLTIDQTKIDADLTNFPVAVVLTSSNFTYTNAQNAGQDIRFTDANGTPLPHEIEKWNTSATSTIWVKVPAVDSEVDTTIYMYYGNGSVADGQKIAEVWDDDFASVYHLNETPYCPGFSNQSFHYDSSKYLGSLRCIYFTGNSTTTADGILDGADFFDSANFSRLEGDNQFQLSGMPQFTLEAWVRNDVRPTGSAQEIIRKTHSVSPWSSYNFYLNTDGKLYFNFLNQNGVGNYYDGTNVLATSTWYHVVALYDGTYQRVYINGVLDGQDTTSGGSVYKSDSSVLVGSGGYWDGIIDEVRVQTTARSEAWIKASYESGKNNLITFASEEKGPGPVAYWGFEEGSGTNITDLSGNGHTLIASSTVWKTESECKSGKCIYFDGATSVATTTNTDELNISGSEITLTGWFKPLTQSGKKMLLNKGSYAQHWNYGFGLNNTGLLMRHNNGDKTTTNVTINTNDWHYFTAVYSGGNDYFYIDGVLVQSMSDSGWSESTGVYQLTLGAAFQSGVGYSEFFHGYLDEVKIYNYARTADQIRNDYNKNFSIALGSNEYTSLSEGLVGWWHMDGNLTDASGNANTGTASGAVATSSGKFGQAYAIGGGTNYISVPTSNSLDSYTDKLTVSGWYYFNNLDAVQQWLFDKANNYYLRVTSTGGFTNYLFGIDNEDYWTTGSGLVTAGRWYYVTFSYDGQERKLYIDGELKASKQDTGSISNGGNLTIGNRSSHTEPMDGQVDDIRMYNRTLSPDEVRRLYEWAPPPVAYWKFDEATGQNVYSSTASSTDSPGGQGYLGTSVSEEAADPVWTQGKYGSAVQFDATNAEQVYIPDPGTNSVYDFTTNDSISLALWVNPLVYGDNDGFINKGSANNENWGIEWEGAGSYNRPQFYFRRDDETGWSLYRTDQSIPLNEWSHIAVSYTFGSSTSIKMYIDGVLTTGSWVAGTGAEIPDNDDTGIYIGKNPWAGEEFTGSIDDVRLYRYIRNPRQVLEDMNAGKKNNPIGYWSFDEAGGQQANDYSGSGYNITLGASTATGTDDPIRFGQGKLNSALQFDGSNDYARASAEVTAYNFGTNDFSVSFYAQFTDAKNYGGLLGQGYLDNEIGWGFYYSSTGRVTFQTRNLGSISDVVSNDPLNDGQWHHIVGKRDNGSLRMYVDGKLQTDIDTVIRDLSGSSEVFAVGARSITNGASFGYNAEATIDEVKVYNYALTMDEIRQNLNTGQTISLSKNINTNRADGLIGWWKMDEASWNGANGEVIDSSGNGWNASSSNAMTTSTAKFSRGGYFNGTNSSINLHAVSFYAPSTPAVSAATFSAWIYPSTTTGYRSIMGRTAYWLTNEAGYGMYIRDGYLVGIASSGMNYEWYDNLKVPISANTWSHVAFTISGLGEKQVGTLYINGQKVDEHIGTTGYYGGYGFLIGAGASTGGSYSNFFEGYIDDVKYYAKQLSSDEIMNEYANSASPLGYWKLDDLSGTTAVDSSGNGNTGTLTSGPVWKERGKVGGATWFDGSDDHILLEKHTALQNFSLSLWFNIVSSPGGSSAVLAGGYTGYGGSLIKVDSATNIRLRTEGDYTSDFTVPTMVQNTWYHLVVTRENSSTRVYLNGKESISGAKTNIGDFVFKKISGYQAGQYFNGTIDDVKLYDYALTQRQVAREYSGGLPVGYWKMDEGEGVAVKDYSGRANHGTLVVGSGGSQSATSSAWTNGASGKINSSLNFDGTDDRVNLGSVTTGENVTISAWIKTSTSSPEVPIFSNRGSGVYFGIASGKFFIYDNSATPSPGMTSNASVNDNNWHHLVWTSNGSSSIMYIDSVIDKTQAQSRGSDTGTAYIAWDASNGTEYFLGQIDEVKIWNYELAPEEIKKEYNGGFSSFFR